MKIRSIAFLAFLFSRAFVFAEKISFPIMGLLTPLPYPVPVEAEFSADWFGGNSFLYNHGLARLACILADVSYVDARKEANALLGCYRALGIKDDDISIDYSPVYQENDNDTAAFSFAILRSFEKPVVIIVIRGTPLSANEWISNLNIADSTKQEEFFHEGFKKAAERILPNLRSFLKKKKIKAEDARFLITGHSRGAAVANLIAADLPTQKDFSADRIFAYTFATPNTTTADSANSEKFGYIWNIESEEDIVQSVPPERGEWRFRKFGRIRMLPSRWKFSEDDFNRKKAKMDKIFEPIMQRSYEPFKIGAFVPIQISRLLTKLNKNVESYYGFLGVRKIDWIFWKIYPENPKEKKDSDSKKFESLSRKFLDMHNCETYLAWMLALDESEIFGKKGSIEFRISGSADAAVFDSSGKLVASAKNGYTEYDKVFSPAAALSYPNRTFVGLPEIENFRIVVQKTSLIPTPITISAKKYDERGILIGETDSKKIWFGCASAVEFNSSEKIDLKKIALEKSLLRGWDFYFAPEIEFAPKNFLSFGLNAGTRNLHAVALISPPIVRDETWLSLGIASEANIWARFYADIALLWNFSWQDEKTQFPSARISISYRPISHAEIFGAARIDMCDFPDDFSISPKFSFGIRF